MRIFRERVHKLAFLSLLTSLLVGIQSPVVQASNAACSSTAAAQNSITVVPSHGNVFYIDSGANVNPKINASYIGYRVTLAAGQATLNNVWVKLSGFAGDKVVLANSLDEKMQIPTLTAGSTGATFFLLKSTDGLATLDDQIHTVEVFVGDPASASAVRKYVCDFTFTEVDDVIAANPNTVTSVALDNSTPALGDLIMTTVTGDVGTIGNGSAPDYDIIWLSPSPYSTFQTRALRLERVTLENTRSGRPGSCPASYENQLLITGAKACFSSTYRAKYYFRVIGASSTPVEITPYANITSGNEIKHTDLDPTKKITLDLSGISPANFTIKKEVTSASVTLTGSNAEVPYKLTISTTSSATVALDLVVDSSTATASAFLAGSATFTDVNRTSATAITPEDRNGDDKLYFVGPFYVKSGTPLVINYKMSLPANGTTYRNEAAAYIGDVEVSNTSGTDYRSIDVNVPTSCTSSPCTITSGGVVAYAAPTATTKAATNVAATTATIGGSFTNGGDPASTVKLTWGTASDLTGGTDVAMGTAATDGETSTALSGLTPGTKYYFRISITNSISTANGEILNFTAGAPTATTSTADQITAISARLRGSFTTGGGQSTSITFTWGTSASLSGGTTVTMGTTTTDSDTSTALSGLTPNTTYYYRISGVAGSVTANGSIVPFTTLGPSATTVAASSITQTGATLNGTIGTGGGVSTTPSFQHGTSATLSTGTTTTNLTAISSNGNVTYALTGLTAGTTYYFRVRATIGSVTDTGTILSFTTTSNSPPPAPEPEPEPDPGPAVIPAPRIESLSKDPVCALGYQITINGWNLGAGVVKLDGKEIPVLSNTGTAITVNLPAGVAGRKNITVTTEGGVATINISYLLVDAPKFGRTYVPYLYQGGTFALFYTATNTDSYRIVGQLPAGLELNAKTGSISGTPVVEGIFNFSIGASNLCGEVLLPVTLDIDKASPHAISHRIYFTRTSPEIPTTALASLERFLEKVKEMSPRHITPQIYITTSSNPYDDENTMTQLEKDRYENICESLVLENIDAEVITGVFTGSENVIEIIAYWPVFR